MILQEFPGAKRAGELDEEVRKRKGNEEEGKCVGQGAKAAERLFNFGSKGK